MRRLALFSAVLLLTGLTVPANAHRQVRVPGAEYQQVAQLDDLTTAGTVASGLTHSGLPQQSGVRGVQIDGYFPDTSHTNTNHGWNHASQFVIRLPEKWN